MTDQHENQHEGHRLAEALQGDPGADESDDYQGGDDVRSLPGVLGTLSTRTLGDLAGRIIDIGRSSHTPFGDHVVRVGQLVADVAAEAHRRLAEDRLPEVGTPAESPVPGE